MLSDSPTLSSYYYRSYYNDIAPNSTEIPKLHLQIPIFQQLCTTPSFGDETIEDSSTDNLDALQNSSLDNESIEDEGDIDKTMSCVKQIAKKCSSYEEKREVSSTSSYASPFTMSLDESYDSDDSKENKKSQHMNSIHKNENERRMKRNKKRNDKRSEDRKRSDSFERRAALVRKKRNKHTKNNSNIVMNVIKGVVIAGIVVIILGLLYQTHKELLDM